MNERILESLRVYLAIKHLITTVSKAVMLGHYSDFRVFLQDVEPLAKIMDTDKISYDKNTLLPLSALAAVTADEYRDVVEQVMGGKRGVGGQSPVMPSDKQDWYQNYVESFKKKSEEEGASLKRQVDAIWDRFVAMVDDSHPDRTHEDEMDNVECIAGLINPMQKIRACGLVAGRVQSGKTRNYIGLILKAFTEGWNTVIVLTSNNTGLARQTDKRIKGDVCKRGKLNPHWLYNFSDKKLRWNTNAPWTEDGQYLGLAQKEDDHLNKIKQWLDGLGEEALGKMRLLVIDDESDSATPDSQQGHSLVFTMNDIEHHINAWPDSEPTRWVERLFRAMRHIGGRNPDESDPSVLEMVRRIDCAEGSEKVRNLVNELRQANKDKDVFDCCLNPAGDYWMLLGLDREVIDSDGMVVPVGNLVRSSFGRSARGTGLVKQQSQRVFAAIMRCLFVVEIERSKINRMLCRLVSREKTGWFTYGFKNAGYIGYTATPAANIVNEINAENPLAADFAFSMEVPRRYFGFEKMFGPSEGQNDVTMNMDIVEKVVDRDDIEVLEAIDHLDNGEALNLDSDLALIKDDDSGAQSRIESPVWTSMKDALAWLFCTAAVRCLNWESLDVLERKQAIKEGETERRWTTMLLNIDHRIFVHKELQKKLYAYLSRIRDDKAFGAQFLERCENVWKRQTRKFTSAAFRRACEDYCQTEGEWASIVYPEWAVVKDKIENYFFNHLKSDVEDPDGRLDLGRVHVVSINSKHAGRNEAEVFDGPANLHHYTHPDDPACAVGDECHIWILCGGNTISRGLTLPGLTVSYFDRLGAATPIDMLTQMGRWFGYREGYELLPRIWMVRPLAVEIKQMCKIETEMHKSIRMGFEFGHSPKNTEHQLELMSYGRPLSGRSAAYLVTGFGLGQAFDSFKTLYLDVGRRRRMFDQTKKFLSSLRRDLLPEDDPRRRAYHEKLFRYPYFEASSGQVMHYLNDLLHDGLYPDGNVRKSVEALVREIDHNAHVCWDVVVNDPKVERVCQDVVGNDSKAEQVCQDVYEDAGSLLEKIHLANRGGDGRAGIKVEGDVVTFGKMSNTDFRGNFARVERRILARAECDLIDSKMRILGAKFPLEYPTKEAVLEEVSRVRAELDGGREAELPAVIRTFYGVSRMTGDAYRNAVFSIPEIKSHNPILQITLVNVPNEYRAREGAEDAPFVVLSFFWPGHPADGYFTGKAGVPAEPVLDDWIIAQEIARIMREYKFMHKSSLQELLAERIGVPSDRLAAGNILTSALRYQKMGYRVFKTIRGDVLATLFKSDIVYWCDWCPDESKFKDKVVQEVCDFVSVQPSGAEFVALAHSPRFGSLIPVRGRNTCEDAWSAWYMNYCI